MRLVNCQAAANVAAATASKCCKCLQLLQLPGKPATAMPQLPSLSLCCLSGTLSLSPPLSLSLAHLPLCFVCWPKQLKTWQRASNLIEQVRQQVDNSATRGRGSASGGRWRGRAGRHSCLVVASGILGGCYAGRPAFKGVCNTHELAKAALPCAKSPPPLPPPSLCLPWGTACEAYCESIKVSERIKNELSSERHLATATGSGKRLTGKRKG